MALLYRPVSFYIMNGQLLRSGDVLGSDPTWYMLFEDLPLAARNSAPLFDSVQCTLERYVGRWCRWYVEVNDELLNEDDYLLFLKEIADGDPRLLGVAITTLTCHAKSISNKHQPRIALARSTRECSLRCI